MDSTAITALQSNMSKHCLLNARMTELSDSVVLKMTDLCFEKVYFRNEMIFVSSTNQLKVDMYADDTILNNKRKKGVLLYYQGKF